MGKANKKMQGVAAMNKLSPFLVNLQAIKISDRALYSGIVGDLQYVVVLNKEDFTMQMFS